MRGRIPFWGEVAVQPPALHSDTTTLTPLPTRHQTLELSPQKGPGTSHCPSFVPREPPSPVSFSSRCKDCSEGAPFSLTSQTQKCLYVGVCLRNNRLLFIKAPFILFAGMCFLGSRGWDAQWSPVRDATANFQGCAGARGRGAECAQALGRCAPVAGALPSTGRHAFCQQSSSFCQIPFFVAFRMQEVLFFTKSPC